MIDFCETYFAAHHIPLTCCQGGRQIYSSMYSALHIEPLPVTIFESSDKNPDFHADASGMLYGRIRMKDGGYTLDIGPVSEIPVTDAMSHLFLRDNAIPKESRPAVTAFLKNIPQLTSSQFLYHLVFLHYVLNQERVSITEHFFQNGETASFLEEETINAYNNKENLNLHNTYFYEQNLYALIQKGNVADLEAFLLQSNNRLREGTLANTPLRQAKNIFIGTATKAGMMGAIPGGVDIEQVYELMDLYIQEAESMNSIEEIQQLQYSMLLDFCCRAHDSKIPEGIPTDLFIAMDFIRTHTNEPISIADVAKQLNRSSSYTIQIFKKNLGINIGAYITRCKLEEAKSLLAYSTKSLLEISTYLCFSSQAYFQNVFKKKFGMTPMQYRNQHRSGSQ
ncbi:MAG: AraC family transcriptional regulator [Blautia sp.]|nr:AraC family transcriptional regulator [Lachnoclostridium sp.]MCM1211948.1 AraC family transcriptional regulator [Blautia sp.]